MDDSKKTISSYRSKQAVDVYARKLLPERRPPLRMAFQRFLENLQPRAKILDIGCGTGKDVGYMRSQGYEAFGLDVSEGMVEAASRLHGDFFSCINILESDFNLSEKFDAVTAIAVLQHIPKSEIREIISGFRILLNDGGHLFIFTKCGDKNYWDYRLGPEHPRLMICYRLEELLGLIEGGGFECLEHQTFVLPRESRDEEWMTILARC